MILELFISRINITSHTRWKKLLYIRVYFNLEIYLSLGLTMTGVTVLTSYRVGSIGVINVIGGFTCKNTTSDNKIYLNSFLSSPLFSSALTK